LGTPYLVSPSRRLPRRQSTKRSHVVHTSIKNEKNEETSSA
jgi:hypothetical protein